MESKHDCREMRYEMWLLEDKGVREKLTEAPSLSDRKKAPARNNRQEIQEEAGVCRRRL